MNIYLKIYAILNKHRKHIPSLIDTGIAAISYIIPFLLTGYKPAKLIVIEKSILIYVAIYIGTFFALKIYKNMWRFTGIVDIYMCLIASVVANILFYATTKIFGVTVYYYVYPAATVLSSLFTTAVRIVYRAILIIGGREHSVKNAKSKEKNIMIIGAGKATLVMLYEIGSNNHDNYSVKCIIDDDKTKIGRRIGSIPVVGDSSKILEMAKKYDITEIVVAIPSIDPENKKRILDICTKANCKLRILPEIYSLIENKESNLIGQIRDVQVEDLLGREPINFDCAINTSYIKGKVVMVTGGGGSIGSELCRQIASCLPRRLIILDIYENTTYEIQQELIRTYGDKLDLEVEIASVRDKPKLDKIFASRNIDIIYHAAAHKHVPLMEKNPEEAVKNNIVGTYNMALVADKYKVKKFVMISTDKAVNPTNIMGATKRVCEMIVQAFDKRSKTDYVAVRFGNVLGSHGSVIPLFVEQIKAGGPVTVTHEEITRFFMTIPEAVQLVMRASAIAKGGEIFVLDMGQPVKIKDLAFNLIKLSGLVPNKDIEIKYTGLRPGEKLYEELLITETSGQEKTEVDKIFIERPVEISEEYLFSKIYQLEIAAHELDNETVLYLMEELVPTYRITPNSIEDIAEKETA